MTTLRESLQAEFTNGEVLQRPGRGGGPAMDYIEDETVMDRLDDALGVGNWSILVEPISLADGVVKVRLGIKLDEWVWYEDFGYANNAQNDGLKEAVTDGIRRVGRMPGVARYLYHKHTSAGAPARSSGNGRAAAPPPPARPPARSSTDVPEDPYADLPSEWDAGAANGGSKSDNNECPIHGVTWVGEWTDLWHKTDDPQFPGGYCRHPENIKKDRPRSGSRR